MQFYHLLVFWPTLLLIVDGLPRSPLIRRIVPANSNESQAYVVSIEFNGFTICGGSIISRDLILTTASCTTDENFPNVKIRACRSNRHSNGSLHYVKTYIRHKNFNASRSRKSGMMINDIALVKVEPAFDFNDKCHPILLYDADEVGKAGSKGIVSGWGNRAPEDDNNYDRIRSFPVTIFDEAACLRMYWDKVKYSPKPGQICAGSNKASPCRGDAGNPLLVDGRQAGIVSWGPHCIYANDAFPPAAIFSEIAYFRRWIDEQAIEVSDFNVDFSKMPFTNKLA